MFLQFASIILIAGLASWVLIRTVDIHGHMSIDHVDGVQKNHEHDVPRIGGIAIYLSTWIAYIFLFRSEPDILIALIASLPVFIAGLTEDLTRQVGWRVRLFLAIIAASSFVMLTRAVVLELDIPPLEPIMRWHFAPILITIIAIAAITNAMNIVDGFNGLTAGLSLLIMSSYALLAWQKQDLALLVFFCAPAAAIIGFLPFNYPFARMFLGDGGAYFLGFHIACGAVLLLARHEDISNWSVILPLAFPIYETLTTIWRRILRKGRSLVEPDGVHMHNLIHRSWAAPLRSKLGWNISSNALTSPFLWLYTLIAIALQQLTLNSQIWAQIAMGLLLILYLLLYMRLSLLYIHLKNRLKGRAN